MKNLIKKMLVCGCFFAAAVVFAGGKADGKSGVVPENSGTPVKTAPFREITDVTGRKVRLPSKVDRVFAMSAIGSLHIYALAPEKLVGWNYAFSAAEKQYLLPSVRDLPNLGGAGGTAVNFEELLKLKPDVIVMFQFQDPERADAIELKTGVPVVIFDNTLASVPASLDLLGTVLGVSERAATLAAYARAALDSPSMPEAQRLSVYYAEGKDGLLTEPAGSDHAEVIAAAGAKNAAEIPAKANQTAVSLEQVLLWNPDVIIAWGSGRGGYAAGIRTDPRWKDITAVKNSRVYTIPNAPFNWVDRPYSVNRLLGVRWLRALLYPAQGGEDMTALVQNFYRLFYHYDLSPQQAQELLAETGR